MPIFVIIIFAAVIGGIIYSFYTSDKYAVRRKFKKAQLLKLVNFKSGQSGKIIGHIEFVDSPLIAPLSGRACSFYEVVVRQKKSSGKNSHWVTVINETDSSRFVIKNGNHYAYINDENLRYYMVQDKEYNSGFGNDAKEKLEAFLIKHDFESEGFFGMNKTLRYKEAVLVKNEKVALYGTGNWVYAVDLGLPDSYGKVLEVKAPVEDMVYLTDDVTTSIEAATKNHNKPSGNKKIEINGEERDKRDVPKGTRNRRDGGYLKE